MLITRNIMLRLFVVAFLTLGLILAPVLPDIASAEEGAGAAGAGSYKKPTGAAGGAASGVGVSGPSGKPATTGKGALAPPKGAQTPPAKSAGQQPPETEGTQTTPKGIAASAGTAGTAAAATGGGISLGWKIAGGVLGVGLLVGLAGGGGSSGGTPTTPSH